MIDHKVSYDHQKDADMGKFYLTLISMCIYFLSLENSWAQCPTLVKYEAKSEQTPSGNDGSLTFTLQEDGSASSAINLRGYEFNLWNKDKGGYLYNPSKLDAGFFEDRRIILSITSPGTVEFKNVPPGDSYFLVISSETCKSVYGPEAGISIKKFDR